MRTDIRLPNLYIGERIEKTELLSSNKHFKLITTVDMSWNIVEEPGGSGEEEGAENVEDAERLRFLNKDVI